nr:hypothetical protein StreXyl84_16200 [Streptomyces sp. Xyl84]
MGPRVRLASGDGARQSVEHTREDTPGAGTCRTEAAVRHRRDTGCGAVRDVLHVWETGLDNLKH